MKLNCQFPVGEDSLLLFIAVRMVGAADIRGAFHMAEAEQKSFFAVAFKLGRLNEGGNGVVIAARRQVLADTQIVAAGRADIKESGEYLFFCFSKSEHDAGFSRNLRGRAFGCLKEFHGAPVISSGADWV